MQDLEFSWSCVEMRRKDSSDPAEKCQDIHGKQARFPSARDTDLRNSSIMKFVPSALELQDGCVYTFSVEVRSQNSPPGCDTTMRMVSATVSVMVASKETEPLPDLRIAV